MMLHCEGAGWAGQHASPIQQLIKNGDPSIMQYAANERENFERYILKSWCPQPPRGKSGNTFETYPPQSSWDWSDSTRLENSSRDPPWPGSTGHKSHVSHRVNLSFSSLATEPKGSECVHICPVGVMVVSASIRMTVGIWQEVQLPAQSHPRFFPFFLSLYEVLRDCRGQHETGKVVSRPALSRRALDDTEVQ